MMWGLNMPGMGGTSVTMSKQVSGPGGDATWVRDLTFYTQASSTPRQATKGEAVTFMDQHGREWG